MPVKLTIGGEVYETAIMNLATLRRVIPKVNEMRRLAPQMERMAALDRPGADVEAIMAGVDDDALDRSFEIMLFLMEAGLSGNEDESKRLTSDQINEKLKAPELADLQAAVGPILTENAIGTSPSGEQPAPDAGATPVPNRQARRAAAASSPKK